VQFDAQLGKPAENRSRVDAIMSRAGIQCGDLNLLVLPEMAFSGYCFKDRTEVEPFAESATDGATATWCRQTARRLGCHVACGFPEALPPHPQPLSPGGERGEKGPPPHPQPLSPGGERGVILYNAMILVDPAGETVHVHRKHFLYTTDETWASEGPGFTCMDVPGLGHCAFAICMDFNPKQFKAPFDRHEFASSLFEPALKHREAYDPQRHRLKANLVIACNNWLRSALDRGLADEEHQVRLLNYWAARMAPVLDLPVTLVIANRVGVERGTTFAGTSCVIDLKNRAVLGNLNGTDEGVLVIRVPS